MSDISVTNKQVQSHLYLRHLVLKQELTDFNLTDTSLTQVDGSKFENSRFQTLVIFAEGLQLAQLLRVSDCLSSYLEIGYFSVVQAEGVAGFSIAAKVSVTNSEGLNLALFELAEELSIELCLVDKVPSLDEPGLLLMDMDSTVIAVECIDEIAALAGVGKQVASVTAQAMQGKLDFAESLRTRVACLADANENIIQQVRLALPLMPGIANLVNVLKQYNWKLAIASGGFTYFADYLAQRLELDAAVANQLEIRDGKLTGLVSGRIIDANVKAETLLELANKWAIPQSQTIAMGDGANDLVMMNAAALGVAFHAKPIVRQKADISIGRGAMDALIWVLIAAQR
ncbi:phosphoserine phosphatase SerB [Paraglaciecola sp.]|uniref:phosphoserine phosphatase SerB n=1 Tax=Paraglaciecola sp. TaxID=1920173 RepID=UPI003EFA0991